MATEPVREQYGGEAYEYYPPGEHIVSAPGVCGGRPTFKYTRIDVRHVLSSLAAGEPPDRIVESFGGRITRAAVDEAHRLALQWAARAFEDPYVPEDMAA